MAATPTSSNTTGTASAVSPGSTGDLTPDQVKKRRKFNRTLRQIMREERPMSDAEMADMFDDDGDLGTQMRRLLLGQ